MQVLKSRWIDLFKCSKELPRRYLLMHNVIYIAAYITLFSCSLTTYQLLKRFQITNQEKESRTWSKHYFTAIFGRLTNRINSSEGGVQAPEFIPDKVDSQSNNVSTDEISCSTLTASSNTGIQLVIDPAMPIHYCVSVNFIPLYYLTLLNARWSDICTSFAQTKEDHHPQFPGRQLT